MFKNLFALLASLLNFAPARPYCILIVLTNDGIVVDSFAFIGPAADAAVKAEAKFLELCEGSTNWNPENADDALDAGHYEWGTWAVCLTHPEIKHC